MTNITPLLLILKFAVVEILFARGVEMQMLSVTRGKEDSFVADGSSGCQCDTFNSNRTISHGDSKICSCRCPSDAPTFYFKKGEERCWKNKEVISDDEPQCDYYFASEGIRSLHVVDLQIGQTMEEIEPNYGCKPLVVDHWQYRQNRTWWNSSLVNIFSVKMKKVKLKRSPFLQWNRLPDRQYQGLLMKVFLVCSLGTGGKEKTCIMFKTHGTHTVSGHIPTTSIPTTSIPTETVTDDKEESTIIVQPTPDSSQGLKETIVIALITVAAVFFLLVVALVVFMCMRRQKRRVRKSTRAQSTPQNSPMVPFHAYEYIQYPPLVSDNPLYERGPDNQLIVISRGDSTSSSLFPSVDKNAQSSSSSVLIGGEGRMTLEPDEQDVQPYQKLSIQRELLGNDGYEEAIPETASHVTKPGDLNMYQSLKKAPNSESESEENIRPVHPQNDSHNDTLMSNKSDESTTEFNKGSHAQGIESEPVGADRQCDESLPCGAVKTSVSSDNACVYMVLEGP